MARLIAGSLTALLLLSPSLATSQTNATSSSAPSNSLTGCLVKAGDGYKVRNAKYPRGIEVSLPDGYKVDVGNIVTLSGNWGVYPKPGEYGTISIGAGGQATTTNVIRVFAVSGVTNIGKACALAAGEAPKAVTGSDKGAPPMRATISPDVAAGMLLEKTNPIYPPIAKAARVSGTVVLRAVISKDGTIEDLLVISGPSMLQAAALDAVRTWRYKPYLLDKRPVEVETTVNVVFANAGVPVAAAQANEAKDDEHPTALVADWSGFKSGVGTVLFRLRSDGTATVADMRYPNVLCQDGSWRVREGALFYDMDGDHQSTRYELESNILSISVNGIKWELKRSSIPNEDKGCPHNAAGSSVPR